jgi:solute carrier family 27 fatty acid transporter 1/4
VELKKGDLMMYDSFGYVYFCDRLGDTYRWKGENVSTIEVENVISKHLNSAEVVVYGVEVPGEEGRAGMAAVKMDKNIDLNALASAMKKDLPAYSKPLFIRFVSELEHTGIIIKLEF